MYRTRVGYTGGDKEFPTYQSLGNHTESVQIDFDENVISYEELLDLFLAYHNPHSQPYSQQYKSAIYYADEAQKMAAQQKKADLEEETGMTVHTEILPVETFYIAEAYHHKYYLRKVSILAQELEEKYPTLDAFLDAPSVTWINGYVFGCRSIEALLKDLPSFGLSFEAEETLKDIVKKHNFQPVCTTE